MMFAIPCDSMKRVLCALGLVLLCLSVQLQGALSNPDTQTCSGASIVFCSEFEEGSLSGWSTINGPATIVADPGPFAQAGNNVLRLSAPPGTVGSNVIKTFTGARRIYARWYQKFEAGYDFGARSHAGGLHAGDRWSYGRSGYRPKGDDWYSTWLEPVYQETGKGRLNLYGYYRGMYMDCGDPNGSCWGDHFPCMVGSSYCTKLPIRVPPPYPPVIQPDRWYCLELMLDGGTPTLIQAGANGIQNFWVDGVEIGPWTDLWHRTTAAGMDVNLFSLALYLPGPHPDVGIRYDNVVVSKSRIGCVGGALPPAAPQNLRIVR
jgi:hypothetical protein